MNKREKTLVSIGLLTAVAALIGVALDIQWLRILTKPILMICLMVWIWPPSGGYSSWVLAGLAFSIAGGVLLEIDGQFLFGLIAFLLAHLAYIGAYLADTKRLAIARAWPFYLYGVGVFFLLLPGLGEMAIPVAVYIFAICTMMWRAAAMVGASGAPTPRERAALVGAILFALSDTLIGVFVFLKPIWALNYPILLLYWFGQMGIAYSAKRKIEDSQV